MSWQVRCAYRAARKGNFECDNVRERGPVFSEHGPPFSTLEVWQAFCNVNNLECEYAEQYGEPGYNSAAKGVLLCNWNHVPKKLADRLEAQGYECEWSDEWMIDYEARDEGKPTSKAYRTSPDCHDWESRVRAADGYYLTPDSDPQEWIDDAKDNDSRPLPSWFDEDELTKRGYAVVMKDGYEASYEVGFHPGQDETPDKVGLPALREDGYETILQIGGRGQFDVNYRIWTRREAKRGCLFDDASGVYIPQRFAREIDRERCTFSTDFEPCDWEVLEQGPTADNELYWDVWQDVLDHCTLKLDDDTNVTLEQDGSVFYVEVGAEYCEDEDTYYVHKQY